MKFNQQNINLYEQVPSTPFNKGIMVAICLFFFLVLLSGGIYFWFSPRAIISESENRNLAQMPIIDQKMILSGNYAKNFEQFYNDQFLLREFFLNTAEYIKTARGIQSDQLRVITVSGGDIDNGAVGELAGVANSGNDAGNTQETALLADDDMQNNAQNKYSESGQNNAQNNLPAENFDNEFSKIKGVVVTNGRVVQVFSGSKASILPFAELINEFADKLSGKKVYAMLIPAGSDFYLPKEVNKGKLKERENIDLFKTLLSPKVTHVDAYNELAPHTNEYISYRTDHHWTGLGAYYAYRAFAQQAGFIPLELDQLEHKTAKSTFLGSLYKYTKDNSLKNHADLLEYYKIPGKYRVQIFDKNGKNPKAGSLYYENTNNYGVFLGGDFPMIHIEHLTDATESGKLSDKPNGDSSKNAQFSFNVGSNKSAQYSGENVQNNTIKNNIAQNNTAHMPEKHKILIIKDSFGNALSTYLPYHYRDVYVVDYRYFKGNVVQFMQENEIDELLYAHNTFAANSHAVVSYGKAFK